MQKYAYRLVNELNEHLSECVVRDIDEAWEYFESLFDDEVLKSCEVVWACEQHPPIVERHDHT